MKFNRHITLAMVLGTILFAQGCVKTTIVDLSPEVPVNFNVAGRPETKAVYSGSGLLREKCRNFYCNAWFNPPAGIANQRFMENAEVLPQGLDENGLNPTGWAPGRTYFWPRTGYVNFFSYVDRRGMLDSGNYLSVSDYGRRFTITDYTVQDSDNIMVADAVYHATKANAGTSPADIIKDNDNTNKDNPLTGVPTLFHHLLANVSIKMKLHVPSGSPTTTDTDYQVIIENITLSNVLCQGSICLTNPGSNVYAMQPWSLRPSDPTLPEVSNIFDGTVIGWEPSSGSSRQDFDLTPDEGTYLTLAHGTDESSEEIVLMGGAVLPQNVVDMTMTMRLTVRQWHGGVGTGTMYNEDKGVTIHFSIETASGIDAWHINQKIMYMVGYNPISSTVSFDPAVESWDDPDTIVEISTN